MTQESNTIWVLMEEYKVIASRADQFSALIWKLATLLITLSAGGIVLVAQMDKHEFEDFYLVVLLAGAIMLAVWWWNRVADRWNSYINLWYIRMREIETMDDMGMWACRYINLMDRFHRNESITDQNEQNKIINLKPLLRHSDESVQLLRRRLMYGVVLVWVGVLSQQAYLCWQTMYNPPTYNLWLLIVVIVVVPIFLLYGGAIGIKKFAEIQDDRAEQRIAKTKRTREEL